MSELIATISVNLKEGSCTISGSEDFINKYKNEIFEFIKKK
jgi:hypothetical protein